MCFVSHVEKYRLPDCWEDVTWGITLKISVTDLEPPHALNGLLERLISRMEIPLKRTHEVAAMFYTIS